MPHPDFDEQARELVNSFPGDEYWIDRKASAALISTALRAAYCAGLEEGAKHLEERASGMGDNITAQTMAGIYRAEAAMIRKLGEEQH